MPNYDYQCPNCGHVIELSHSMSDNPKVKCDKCKGTMSRAFLSPPGFHHGGTLEMERALDQSKARMEMHCDLRDNYGVEELRPVVNAEGKGYEDAYKDIKERGSMVRDNMQAKREKSRKETDKKIKKRKEKMTPKVIEKRKKIIVEKRQENAFNDRKISVQSGVKKI